MADRAQLTATIGFGPTGRRKRTDAPLRFLVLSDLSGSVAKELRLVPRRVTIDRLDDVLATIGPELPDPVDPSRQLRPRALDHFHPDHLVTSVTGLAELLELRTALGDTARRDRALAVLREMTGPESTSTAVPRTEPAKPAEGSEELLTRLLGRSANSEPRGRAKDAVDALIKGALSGVATAPPTPDDKDADDRLQRLLEERCRAVLTAPAFRALERAWRSIHWLLSRLENDEAEIHVVDVGKEALAAHLASSGSNLDASPLHALLVDDEQGWDLVVGDYSFSLSPSDTLTLATIGALASRARSPFIAHGDLSLVGCMSSDAIHQPSSWSLPDDELGRLWTEFRRHPAAAWIGLATPRFVLRFPYGRRSDPIERFDFEELPSKPAPGRFLWGNPAFACALLLARAHAQDGSQWPCATPDPVDDLPTPTYDDGSGEAIQPPLELILNERARVSAQQHGLIVLSSGHNTNRIAVDGLFAVAAD